MMMEEKRAFPWLQGAWFYILSTLCLMWGFLQFLFYFIMDIDLDREMKSFVDKEAWKETGRGFVDNAKHEFGILCRLPRVFMIIMFGVFMVAYYYLLSTYYDIRRLIKGEPKKQFFEYAPLSLKWFNHRVTK